MNDELILNERVEVVVKFTNGHHPCIPVKFRRTNGREVKVTKLGLRHPTLQGHHTIHIFDVTDDGADYRLEFDSERLTWRLTREADRYD